MDNRGERRDGAGKKVVGAATMRGRKVSKEKGGGAAARFSLEREEEVWERVRDVSYERRTRGASSVVSGGGERKGRKGDVV